MKLRKWMVVGVALILALSLTGCVSQTQFDTLLEEKASLGVELASLRVDYDELEVEKVALEGELAEIKEVYPPRYFSDYNELDEWLESTIPQLSSYTDSWRKCLALQRLALADGFIWSVSYEVDTGYYVGLAIAGDSIYYVWGDGYNEWADWKY